MINLPLSQREVCFLWHFPAGHPDWPLASTLPCGAPTFLSQQPPLLAATTRPGFCPPGRCRSPDGWSSIYAVYQGTSTGPAVPVLTLLRVGFAEPPGSPRALVRSCRTVSPLPVAPAAPAPIGGLFSVALSCGSPRLAVSQHPALWSPDLPQQAPPLHAMLLPRPP
jgi:hypothetical protein